MAKAKPFIKWVGGKSQLIEQLDALLPADFDNWKNITYIEPFVGGGAMLFYMLQRYPNIQHAIINDINPDLATCYRTVRDNPNQLIESLRDIESAYFALQSEEGRKEGSPAKPRGLSIQPCKSEKEEPYIRHSSQGRSECLYLRIE